MGALLTVECDDVGRVAVGREAEYYHLSEKNEDKYEPKQNSGKLVAAIRIAKR